MDVRIEIHGHKNHELTEEYTRNRIEDQLGKFPFITSCEIHLRPASADSGYDAKIEAHVKSGAPIFAHAKDVSESKAIAKVISKTQRQLKKYKNKHYQNKALKG